MVSLVEVDSVEIQVVVDNEVDPMSPYNPAGVEVAGQMRDLGMKSPHKLHDRAGAIQEIKMWDICCGAHGLSLMIVSCARRMCSLKLSDLSRNRLLSKTAYGERCSSIRPQKKTCGTKTPESCAPRSSISSTFTSLIGTETTLVGCSERSR